MRSLRTWLLIGGLLLTGLIGGSILLVVYLQERAAAARIGEVESIEGCNRAHLRMQQVLRAAESTVTSAVRASGPRIADTRNWQPIFIALMSAFEQRPSLTYLGFSDARTGEAAFLHRKPDGVVEWLVYLDKPGGRTIRSYRYQTGEFIFSSEVPWDGWDPRNRPYFQLAQKKHGPAWTESYVFTDPEGRKSTMGVTYAVPVYDTNDGLIGVWDSDFDSRALCDAMRQCDADFGGLTFLIENRASGRQMLVAHPQDTYVTGDEVPARSVEEWVREETTRAFSNVGTTPLFQSRNFEPPSPHWTIVTIISGSHYANLYLRQRAWLLFATFLGVALLSTFGSLMLARQVARPIEALRGSVARLMRGEPIQPYEGRAPREMRELTEEFTHLMRIVEERQGLLEESKQKLESEVSERAMREALLSAVFAHVPFELWVVDRQGAVLLQSAASRLSLGEITGKPFHKAAASRAWALEWESSFNRALAGEIIHIEVVEHPSVEPRYLHALLAGVPSANGRVEDIVCVCIDVTEKRSAEEALIASQRRLSIHLENTPLGVIEWTPDLKVAAWNRAAEVVFGWPASEAIGRHASFITPEESMRDLERTWAELLAGKRAARHYSQNLTKDGRVIDCEWYNAIVTEPDGRVSGVSSLVLDVTERMRAELLFRESEERFQKAFRRAPVAQAIVRISDFALLDVNDRWCEVHGHPRRYAIGRTESELGVWSGDSGTHEEVLRTLNKVGEVRDVEVRRLGASGKPNVYLVSVTLVTLGSAPAMIVSEVDISLRKNAEQEILALNEGLERRVAQRTEELALANEKLQELDRLKSEFLATMSHELRTPLNAIIGFSSILRLGMAGKLAEEQQRQVELILGSARHLLTLINDLLDLSRIEAGRLELAAESFSLGALLEEVQKTLEPMVATKGLSYSTSCSDNLPEFFTDRKRVLQVMINLANNAVKFTEKGGVTVEASLASPGLVRIAVTDTGIGIREDSLPRLFEAFRQVDGSARRVFEGTGLGLYLVRKLLDMLGGQVSVASRFGVGSTFTVLLPARLAPESAKAASSHWQPQPPPLP